MSHKDQKIIIKTPQQIAYIREAGRHLTALHHILRDATAP